MHFGQNESRGGGLQSTRLLALLVFGAVIVVTVLGVNIFKTLTGPVESESGPTVSRDDLPIKIGSEHLFPTDIAGPAPVRAPEPTGSEPAAGVIPAWTEELSTDGVVRFFQEIRNDATWANEPLAGRANENSTELWETLYTRPVENQGRVVYLEGTLVAEDRGSSPLELNDLPPDNPSGLDRFFEAYLFDGAKLFMVLVWRRPDLPFRDGDGVRVRGRFLQMRRYETRREEANLRIGAVPVIVADSFTRIEPSQVSTFTGPLYLLLFVFLGIFAVVVVAVLLIMRRGDRRHRDRVRQMRARLRSRPPAAAGVGPAGSTTPGDAVDAES